MGMRLITFGTGPLHGHSFTGLSFRYGQGAVVLETGDGFEFTAGEAISARGNHQRGQAVLYAIRVWVLWMCFASCQRAVGSLSANSRAKPFLSRYRSGGLLRPAPFMGIRSPD
ncbi:MAG: hypothetical protein KatS3mg105_2868 [Gemmatales bacterium]|nr:MAG: hypothetical protein KatS3mg105_2868 [Gemmatales bacterium]